MSDCRHLKPKICGNKLKPFLSDKGCGVPRFVGIEDVTINQGIGIDLTEGVYAYDGNGNEIEYTVTPDSIDMCDVGEHTVIYRAMAEGKKFAPWFCSKQRGLAGDLLCNRVALRKDRTVTIEQIDPPRIEGLDTVKISPNVEFDPTEGVTAIDGNGNEIEYTYSGLADAVAEGAIASFETEFEQNARSVVAQIEPIQSGSGTPSPDNVRPIYGHTEVNVTHTGKNLLPTPTLPTVYYWGTDILNSLSVLNALPIGTYTISIKYKVVTLPENGKVQHGRPYLTALINGSQVPVLSYSVVTDNSPTVGKIYMESGTFNITEESKGKFNHAYLYCDQADAHSGSGRGAFEPFDIQLELSSTATDYEPYQGETHTTDLGRTVYGGTLDVVSGVLTVDRAMVTITQFSGQKEDDGFRTQQALSDITEAYGVLTCNMFTRAENYSQATSYNYPNRIGYNGSGVLLLNTPSASTIAELNALIPSEGCQICYPIATPTTIQLTPTEIALLEGTNNVWTDSGDVRVVYQESMPIGESIEYETVGERIITYTATDVCGNTSEVEREILVGITAQACKSQACGAFVYCAPTEACEAIVGLSATACE